MSYDSATNDKPKGFNKFGLSHRSPRKAAAIGLIFGPAIVMAYLGRGWLAIFYFFLGLALTGGVIALKGSATAFTSYLPILVSNAVGLVHGYIAAKQTPRSFPWYSRWYSIFFVFVIIPLGFRSFAFEPFTIPTESMAPTLREGDYVLASKFAFGYNQYSLPVDLGLRLRIFGAHPERGDIVTFRLVYDPSITYIKRVIGLPHDRVQLKSSDLYINGERVSKSAQGEILSDQKKFTTIRETLPSGRAYMVMQALDSSQGNDTAEFIVPEGYYFVLGDNRNLSNDSRYSDVGFVSDNQIFSKVVSVITSSDNSLGNWQTVQ